MYYRIRLGEKVQTDHNRKGSDLCVCRAETRSDALRQIPAAMRDVVLKVEDFYSFRDCYPNPNGILKELTAH